MPRRPALTTLRRAGTAEQPIAIGSYGTGRATLDGPGHTDNVVRYNISENDARKSPGHSGPHVWGGVRNAELYNNTVFTSASGRGSPRDFFGGAVPRHGGYDVGASEYQGQGLALDLSISRVTPALVGATQAP